MLSKWLDEMESEVKVIGFDEMRQLSMENDTARN